MTKTKKEKLVDLKPKAEKITDEQLKRVQSVINQINRLQLELGIMETRKHTLLHQVMGTQNQLNTMQHEFEKDYGTSDINIETGVINYQKENGEVNKKN